MEFTGIALAWRKRPSLYLSETNESDFTFTLCNSEKASDKEYLSEFKSNDITVWVIGEIYNLSTMVIRNHITEANNLAHLIALIYATGKIDKEIKKLEGEFFIQIYDKERQQLKLITDKLGLIPIYYSQTDFQFIWSNRLSAVADMLSNPILDTSAIVCFMELEYILGNKTLFENIGIIEPAHSITLDFQSKELIKKEQYWSWNEITANPIDFEKAVDLTAECFLSSIEKRFNQQKEWACRLVAA
ncbi:MAG: DUF1933 domain-containing protein [Saprospiraceae bacterium]